MSSAVLTAPRPDVPRDEWMRALFDAIDDAVFVHDRHGRILEANPAACRRLGYSREELLHLNTRDIDAPEFAVGFQERLTAQLGQGNFRCEGYHRTKDGHIIPVDINSSTIQINGETVVLAVMRDITQRKRVESRLTLQYVVAQALGEGARLEEATRRILQVTCETLGFDLGALWVVNKPANHLECLEIWQQPTVQAPQLAQWMRSQTLGRGVGIPGQVWHQGKPAWIDIRLAGAHYPRASIALQEGLLCCIAFPMQRGGETTGVIEFFNRTLRKPDDDILNLMAALGNQMAQVLDRQRVEKALRDSEALYHSLVECLPQNIIRKDCQGRVTFANQRYCNHLGMSLDELLSKTDFELFPPELAEKYVADDKRVMDTGAVLETIEAHVKPDGSHLYVEVVKTPIRDAQGHIIGTQCLFWDVTARKQAEDSLAESERRYRQLTEATQDGIVVADQQGRITLFNPAAERMFGYSSREIIGQPVTRLIPDKWRLAHERGFAHFLLTRQGRIVGQVVELTGLRKDGSEFPIELVLSVINLGMPGPDGREPVQILGAFRDVTERNRMRAVLMQNEKLASIGLLSAGVAHEINNPLAFVGNNLVVLERDVRGLLALVETYEQGQCEGELAARLQAIAEEIDLAYLRQNLPRLLKRTRDGVDRVSRIVHSLRGLARTDTPRFQEIHLPDLVDNCLEILRNQLKRAGIEVVQDHDPNPRMPCMPTQINQAILNLLVNAVQAVQTARPTGGGRIVIRTRRLDNDMLIEVSDNGDGIDPQHLPKVFDPFFTTKDVGEGTGLGLAITHNIISGHGGRIEVASQPGQGASFRLYLPLTTSREMT